MDRQTEATSGILIIDYSKSLGEMIALGRYDWVNGDITAKRFPIVGEGVVGYEPKLFHPNRAVSSEDALRQIREDDTENPWTPAKIEHTLAYGATNPEEQRKYPIVGLGSACEIGGGRDVPCLHGDGSERNLYLYWWGDGWRAGYRFLAVRRIITPS